MSLQGLLHTGPRVFDEGQEEVDEAETPLTLRTSPRVRHRKGRPRVSGEGIRYGSHPTPDTGMYPVFPTDFCHSSSPDRRPPDRTAPD